MRNEKGFTLIELIAVIIIIGVLMMVAIPSVTTLISNSRKEVYVSNAKKYIEQSKIKVVTDGKYSEYFYDSSTNDVKYFIGVNDSGIVKYHSISYEEFIQLYSSVVNDCVQKMKILK